jgi:hypothetical protein
VWESIADVSDVSLSLALVEMSREHMLKPFEVIAVGFTCVGHLHHGVHEISRQLKMPKAILAAQLLQLFVILTHHPWNKRAIPQTKEVVYDAHIGKMLGPFRGINVTLVPVVEIVVSWDEDDLIEVFAEMFQGTQAIVQRQDIDSSSIVVPISQHQAYLTTFGFGLGGGPLHKGQAVLIVQLAVAFQPQMEVSEYRGFTE